MTTRPGPTPTTRGDLVVAVDCSTTASSRSRACGPASWASREFAGGDGAALEEAAARLPIGAEGLLTLPYWNAATPRRRTRRAGTSSSRAGRPLRSTRRSRT